MHICGWMDAQRRAGWAAVNPLPSLQCVGNLQPQFLLCIAEYGYERARGNRAVPDASGELGPYQPDWGNFGEPLECTFFVFIRCLEE